MIKRLLNILLFTFLTCSLLAQEAQTIGHVDENSTLELSPNTNYILGDNIEKIQVRELRIGTNATLIIPGNTRLVTIRVDRLFIELGGKIAGAGRPGAFGTTVMPSLIYAGQCAHGMNGSSGFYGFPGGMGASIIIYARTIDIEPMQVDISGGAGGQGSNGTNGAQGGMASQYCTGGSGGDGGNGGKGGNGGGGGTFILKYINGFGADNIVVNNYGGTAGLPGSPGMPGSGGMSSYEKVGGLSGNLGLAGSLGIPGFGGFVEIDQVSTLPKEAYVPPVIASNSNMEREVQGTTKSSGSELIASNKPKKPSWYAVSSNTPFELSVDRNFWQAPHNIEPRKNGKVYYFKSIVGTGILKLAFLESGVEGPNGSSQLLMPMVDRLMITEKNMTITEDEVFEELPWMETGKYASIYVRHGKIDGSNEYSEFHWLHTSAFGTVHIMMYAVRDDHFLSLEQSYVDLISKVKL